jgi:hypothetical protein
MTSEERSRKIESYGLAHQILVESLKRFPREMWQFKPVPDQWSIHDIIIHIAEGEVESYVYCGGLLAKSGYAMPDYDEIKQMHESGGHNQNIDEALASVKKLRLASYTYIKTLPDTAWLPQVNPSKPNAIQMDGWLDIFERHIPEHIEQMQQILHEWIKQNTTYEER